MRHTFYIGIFIALLLAGPLSAAVPKSSPAQTAGQAVTDPRFRAPEGRVIWDLSRLTDRATTRMEFPDLVRFRGHWYCSFREGDIHGNHVSGRGRVIRSADGNQWQSVALMEWEGGDVRDPRLSVTAEGWLMVNTSIYFPARGHRGTPSNETESGGVSRQSVTWLSSDGVNWGSAQACPTGVNTWRWDVTWHNGMGYSIAYSGKDDGGTLYRTRDGRSWRMLKDKLFPDGKGNEADLAFAPDGTAICLLRDSRTRGVIGIGQPPDYQQWQWKDAALDWQGDGRLRPADDLWRRSVGGPKIVRLSDGRYLGIGRIDGRVNIFQIDPVRGVFTRYLEFNGTSYPGLVEHEGQLWVTHGVSAASGIFLVKVPLPQ